MEIDSVPLAPMQGHDAPVATILCATCGAPIVGSTGMTMCEDCIRLNVDISAGIQREATLYHCTGCSRWLNPPNQWVPASMESKELLALCLKRLRGLNKVRLVDASFIWTEPHSKRIKINIKVQEAFQNTFLVQTFPVEYVVVYNQCPECAKTFTPHTWRACVQVRQKVPHKRTFLYLEQLILKHNAHKDCINIREVKDGLDFFFAQRNHAVKLLDFLQAVAPVRSQKSSELISQDIHTSTKSYKFTYSVELVPICKDDLVCLPAKLARQMGNTPQLLLATRIGNTVHLMDPNTLQTTEVPNTVYWRQPFPTLANVSELTEFTVLDIEALGPTRGKHVLSDVELLRVSDNQTFSVRTHLGGILHPGDAALGYLLANSNFNNEHFEQLDAALVPPVVLVKKSYPRSKKKARTRAWRIRRIAEGEGADGARKQDVERAERDMEAFLRSIEEDAELRQTLTLYKSSRKNPPRSQKMEGVEMEVEVEVEEERAEGAEAARGRGEGMAQSTDGEEDEDEDGLPEIPLEELVDEFEEMDIAR